MPKTTNEKRDPLKCCVCGRHVALYMMIDNDGFIYEDPVVAGASFICKRCWNKGEHEKFIGI